MDRYAILLDGEFVKKCLQKRKRQFPSAKDIDDEVCRIKSHSALNPYCLYRIYYYTADPLSGVCKNPMDGTQTDFSKTRPYRENQFLISKLDEIDDYAVRRGVLAMQGWMIGKAAHKAMLAGTKTQLVATDLAPIVKQKGVDMRIGLDIASLALKKLVVTIVLVTGDSDLVPAMKFARREGLRVYLDTLGQSVRPELKTHADVMI